MSMLRELFRKMARPAPAKAAPRERSVHGHRVVEETVEQIFTVTLRASGTGYAPEAQSLPAPVLEQVAPDGFVSAAVLAEKARRFDHRLLASVETLAQNGVGAWKGKTHLLRTLARTIAGTVKPDEASLTVMTAARIGGAGLPEPFATVAQTRAQAFLADPTRAVALGLFAGSQDLEIAGRQERLLCEPLQGKDGIARIAEILRADAALRKIYDDLMLLRSRLDGRPEQPTLHQALDAPVLPASGLSFLPNRRSLDDRIAQRLLGASAPTESRARVDACVRRLRESEISLAPDAESGWHDWIAWSLEPLARPEASPEAVRLRFSDSYRAALLELFRGTLGHAASMRIGAPPMEHGSDREQRALVITPSFRVEPLPTHYLRRGLAYRFLAQSLLEVFGADTLAGLTRATRLGVKSLNDELLEMETLFLGAFHVACEDLGLRLDSAIETDPAPFLRWSGGSDPDLARDARELWPIAYDPARRQVRTLLTLGWTERRIEVAYLTNPPCSVFDPEERLVHERRIGFAPQISRAPAPVTLEVFVSAGMSRSEIRALGDRCGSVEELVHRLR